MGPGRRAGPPSTRRNGRDASPRGHRRSARFPCAGWTPYNSPHESHGLDDDLAAIGETRVVDAARCEIARVAAAVPGHIETAGRGRLEPLAPDRPPLDVEDLEVKRPGRGDHHLEHHRTVERVG